MFLVQPVQPPCTADGHITSCAECELAKPSRALVRARRMPTSSATTNTTASTSRSPRGRTVASPRPNVRAITQEIASAAMLTTSAARTDRPRQRSTSSANSTPQSTMIVRWATMPEATTPGDSSSDLRPGPAKTSAIARNGSAALPSRLPIATSAPAVADAATLPAMTPVTMGFPRTPQNKR